MILCIRLVTEKMWATSRKCVFYGIFKNTTKHQKIFSETFFKIQPNTWKYFLFWKITLLKNIYFLKILLREPNAALVSTRLQAPADGNVPSHKAPFRKKTRTWQTCEKKMFPNEKKERRKMSINGFFHYFNVLYLVLIFVGFHGFV